MKALAWKTSLAAALLGALGCGEEVPIGHGESGLNGGSGGTAGSAGTGASAGVAGTGARPGEGGSAGSAGSAGSGATGGSGVGGVAGFGGNAGGGGSSGAGGSTSCPVDTSKLLHQIPAAKIHDVLIVGSDVFFTQGDDTDGTIRRAALATGQAVDFASAATDPGTTDAFKSPDSLVSDGTTLYWRSNSGKSVWKKTIAGGAASTVGTLPNIPFSFAVGANPEALAIGAGKAFWMQGPEQSGPTSQTYRLHSVPLTGGTPTELLAFDSGPSTGTPFMPLSLLTDSSAIYFTLYDSTTSKTVRAGLNGESPTDLFGIGHQMTQSGPSLLITGGAFLFRVPKAGGAPEIVTSGLDPNDFFINQGVVTSGTEAYVSVSGTVGAIPCCQCGWIYSVPTNGMNVTPTVIYANAGRPRAISAGGGYVASADIDLDQLLVIQP